MYYAIVAKKGCWGTLNRYEDCLIARVEGAKNKKEALTAFRNTSEARTRFENEFKVLSPSSLTKNQKEWIENYVEEIINL